MASAAKTSIGFRIKSGYAIAVVVTGSPKSPTAVSRRVVELSDPNIEETKQPYHDGFGTAQQDEREIARRVKIIEGCARTSIAALLSDVLARPSSVPTQASGGGLRAALVVGSVIDPKQVGNPHIRAHANEGKLFRTVLEEALRSHGIPCDVIVETQLGVRAQTGLGRRDAEIKQTLVAFGKAIGGPWRADEKAAATAAWLALT